MKTAFVFPGQGSQFVGMGKDLGDATRFFDIANDVLGYDLKQLCFEGPEAVLRKTENAQPAILTCSVAMHSLLGVEPDVVAGHSLGEYTALVVAGVLRFEQAVKLVHLRGKLMESAVPDGEGTMAAILGLDAEKLEALCSADHGVVELANYNCPGQIVISGQTPAVNRVCEKATSAGAKRAILLPVSGPFHSSLMKVISEEFERELNRFTFANAKIPVVTNVTAEYVRDIKDIKQMLIKQISSPVLWQQSVEKMIADGVEEFKEVGPGNVLTGLIRKINR
jgi:[acyl-carrier-protein] S-malonyltransferase